MNGWDSFTAGMYGLLHERGRLQKIINYRSATGFDKDRRRFTMIRCMGLDAWEELLLAYAGCSDDKLKKALQNIDKELEMRLERHFIPG